MEIERTSFFTYPLLLSSSSSFGPSLIMAELVYKPIYIHDPGRRIVCSTGFTTVLPELCLFSEVLCLLCDHSNYTHQERIPRHTDTRRECVCLCARGYVCIRHTHVFIGASSVGLPKGSSHFHFPGYLGIDVGGRKGSPIYTAYIALGSLKPGKFISLSRWKQKGAKDKVASYYNVEIKYGIEYLL